MNRDANSGANSDANDDPLEALREILIGEYRAQATALETELTQVQGVIEALDERINDKDALIETISPIMAQSIRSTIRDSREEMIEAIHPIMADAIQSSISESRDTMIEVLYPILGSLVQRAVIEAMRDLTRTIDNQMRNAFSFQMLKRRLVARASGVSEAEMALRDAMPFAVDEIFLIHRASGLLLRYLEFNPELVDTSAAANMLLPDDSASSVIDLTDAATIIDDDPLADAGALNDSDLISSMLTAIRDFAADAFGRGEEGQLDEVQYGSKSILIEAAPHVYMAVVLSGVEPRGFRAHIRTQVFEIEDKFLRQLRNYDGDPMPFAATSEALGALASYRYAPSLPQAISISVKKSADGKSTSVKSAGIKPTSMKFPRVKFTRANIQAILLISVILIFVFLLFGWGFIQSLFR